MAFPLLQQLMIGARRGDLQLALLTVDTELRPTNMNKQNLISEIELHAKRDDATHTSLCDFLLHPITKQKIHELIRSIKPISSKITKRDAIKIFVKLDADARRARDDSQLQLVACPPPDPQQIVPIQSGRLKKRLFKQWTKAAARKVLSEKIGRCVKEVLQDSAPCRRIDDILKDVERKVGSPLTGAAARSFRWKKLMSALIKRTRKPRRRNPRRRNPRARFTVWLGGGLPPQAEALRMWENDHWLMKHSMLDTPAIRKHQEKVRKKRSADTGLPSGSTKADCDASPLLALTWPYKYE